MQVIWEKHDIRVGRRMRKLGHNEVWMIGYLMENQYSDRSKVKGHPRVLISLEDGSVNQTFGTPEEMVEALNRRKLVPIELCGEKYQKGEKGPEPDPDAPAPEESWN